MSQISPLIFFPSEKDLLLKETTRRTQILISPTWKKILEIWNTLFELVQIEVQYCKKLFQNVFARRSWIFWKYHEKETAKATPKIENICVLYIQREYMLCLQSNANGSFFKKSINFVEQRPTFSHFEGGNIIL